MTKIFLLLFAINFSCLLVPCSYADNTMETMETMESKSVYPALESSGVLSTIEVSTRLLKMYSKQDSTFSRFYKDSEFREYVFKFINESLSVEEVQNINKIMLTPFVGKISRAFFQTIDNKDRFENFIQRYGKSAEKEKVELLKKMQKIIQVSSTQPYLQIMMDRALRVLTIKRREDRIKKAPDIKEIEAKALKATKESEVLLLEAEKKQILKYLYYQTKNISNQELKYFLTQYTENTILLKFYKLCQQAKIQYLKNVYSNIVQDLN
jgi:hypothetical protein